MSDHIDTRDGWTPVDVTDPNAVVYSLAQYGDDGELIAAWVREKSVPPLPTELGTAIEVTWIQKNTGRCPRIILWPTDGGFWRDAMNQRLWPAHALQEAIVDFKVLAAPLAQHEFWDIDAENMVRRETAKAVIDALRKPAQARGWDNGLDHLERVARDFEVKL